MFCILGELIYAGSKSILDRSTRVITIDIVSVSKKSGDFQKECFLKNGLAKYNVCAG